MITKLEILTLNQENPKTDPETKTTTKSQKESKKVLLQMKDTLDDHQHVRLSEILKDKE